MEYSREIWVVSGKISQTKASAIITTVNLHRFAFAKVDREIRKLQGGRGKVYYAQFPRDTIGDLDVLIAKSDYELEVSGSDENRKVCLCSFCGSYEQCTNGSNNLLPCSKLAERCSCRINPEECRCEKCQIHAKHYLQKKRYCMGEKAESLNDRKYPDVIYVSDLFYSRLSQIVVSALSAADKAGYESVAFHPLRNDVMWKVIEKGNIERSEETARGLNQYFQQHPESKIRLIKIVVDDDPVIYSSLILAIEKHKLLKKMLGNKRPGIMDSLKRVIKDKTRGIFGI